MAKRSRRLRSVQGVAVIALSILLFSMASSSEARASSPQGFMISGGLSVGSLTLDVEPLRLDDRESTAGLFLMLGYGFTRHFMLYINIEGNSIGEREDRSRFRRDDLRLNAGELGLRLHLPGPTITPYGEIGWGAADLSNDHEDPDRLVELQGLGLHLGAGALISIGPQLAVDLGVKGCFGEYDEYRVGRVTVDISDERARFRYVRFKAGIAAFF